MKKLTALMMVMVLGVTMLAGCGGGSGSGETVETADDNAAAAETAEEYEIVYMVKNRTAPFWISTIEGAQAAGEDLGVKITVKTPVDTAEGSGNEQQSQLCEETIVQGADALIIAPVDSEAIIPAVEKVNDAGIPVINLNTKISDESQYVTFCGLENVTQGYDTAKVVLEEMGGEGTVFIIEGSTGAQTSIDRVQGFENALEEYPDIEVVAQQSANYSRADAMNVVQNLLQSYPDVDAILCCNDEMAMGSAEAVDAAGKIGEILISGQDANDDAVEAVREGRLFATSWGDPYQQGYSSVEAAVKVPNGEEVEDFYEVPTKVVTLENIDTFQDEE